MALQRCPGRNPEMYSYVSWESGERVVLQERIKVTDITMAGYS